MHFECLPFTNVILLWVRDPAKEVFFLKSDRKWASSYTYTNTFAIIELDIHENIFIF